MLKEATMLLPAAVVKGFALNHVAKFRCNSFLPSSSSTFYDMATF